MAISKENLTELYSNYLALAEQQENTADVLDKLRQAASENDPDVFLTINKLNQLSKKRSKKGVTLAIRQKNLNVQALVAAYASMGIQANFDKGSLTLSPDDLRKIIAHRKKREKDFHNTVQGIKISDLLRTSTPIDKARAKTVSFATFYGRKNNILYFNVSGHSKPLYRVLIRLEGWQKEVTAGKPSIVAVQRILADRISIECPCGRHQFWYRYLATLGNYAITPAEYDYPKIRNPTLTGCCCKHVLKVLHELQLMRVQFVLRKEIEAERQKPGYGGNAKSVQVVSQENLSHLLTNKNLEAFKKLIELAKKEEAEKAIKPRVDTTKKEFEERLARAIKYALMSAKATGNSPDFMLNGIAQTNKMTRKQVDDFIKKHKLGDEKKTGTAKVTMDKNQETTLINTINKILDTAKSIDMSPDLMLNTVAEKFNMTSEQLGSFMQEHGINKDA